MTVRLAAGAAPVKGEPHGAARRAGAAATRMEP
jgi:hypothetical protein